MLNYQCFVIQTFINERLWRELSGYEKIKAVYGFVQNKIPLGYNCKDTSTAEQMLTNGYGPCNTKATLL